MAAYGTNIIPNYTTWSTSGTITKTALQLTSSGSNAYAYYTYSQTGISIGNTALITTSGCTGTWYLIMYCFATDNSYQPAFCMEIPHENHTFTLQLPNLTVNNLYFRVVHRGTTEDTCGLITFQYEQAASTNTGYIDESTLSSAGSRTFHSLPDGSASVIKLTDMYRAREVTVATLAVAFDTRLVSAEKSVSIYVDGAAVINYATGVTAAHPMSVYVRLYFGDRMLTQRLFTLTNPYEEIELPISATVHAASLDAEDLIQNIPLRITVSRGEAASASNNTIAINTEQSFISATGPIVLNEHRGAILLDKNSLTLGNGLLSMTPSYGTTGGRWPKGIYYTVPGTPCTVVWMQRTDEYVESDQAAVYPSAVQQTFESTVKKVRVVYVTEISNVASSQVTVKQGVYIYYVVLTTSNQLQVRNSSNAVLFTIATGVVDFDTTLCGLYGVGADEITTYEALFMKRIVGFTVFYTTGSALYVASYPKWDTNVTNLSTHPTLAAMGIYTIDKGSLGTISQMAVSALYQVSLVWRSDGNSYSLGANTYTDFQCWSLQFGLSAHVGNTIVYARISADIPTASTSATHPTISTRNTPRFQVRSSVANSGSTTLVPSAGYTTDNVSVSGTIPLGKMINTAVGSLSLSGTYASGSIYRIEPVGNTYTDTWFEFRREYAHGFLSKIFTSLGTNSHFMPSSAPYVKNVSSSVNYQEEYIVDMLPSGDAAYLYFGQNNGYTYSNYTSYIAHFVKGIMPRINHYFEVSYTTDAARWSVPNTSTLTADTTNKRYALLYKDTADAPVNRVQCVVSNERWAYPMANTVNYTYYQYCLVNNTAYVGGQLISNANMTAYISDISAWSSSGLRNLMQNDFFYTGWMPIKL